MTISATGHTYESVVTDPTCTEAGYTTYTCTVCGAELSRETVVVPATGTSEDEDDSTVEDESDSTVEDEDKCIAILRLYNPYTGEHLYTTDEDKVSVLTELGWEYEGIAFYGVEIGE